MRRRGSVVVLILDELLLVNGVLILVFVVLGVLVMMMVEAVKHAVVLFGIFVLGFVLLRVGVAGGVLLLVHADGVLGLVEKGLVGGAGAGGGAGADGAGVAGGAGRAGVVVLDAGDLVGGGLGGGLVGVGEDVTVRVEVSVGCFSMVRRQGGEKKAYRWTLSVTPETVSVTLSVVDLALFGVAWSATSGKAVSLQWLGGWEREEGDVLLWMSLRPRSDMLAVVFGLRVGCWLVDWSECCWLGC
jgi:hypothetical protein